MNRKELLEIYKKYFWLQKEALEEDYEKYCRTALNALFSEGTAYWGHVVGITAQGHLVLDFGELRSPRHGVLQNLVLLRHRNAFETYGSSISSWRCSLLEFMHNTSCHTKYSEILPLYSLGKSRVGCDCGSDEMVTSVRNYLSSQKKTSNPEKLYFLVIKTQPLTKLLVNLFNYIVKYQDDFNLWRWPMMDYDDWHPVPAKGSSEAIKLIDNYFLTKNLCVLQGPPGSGKTFLIAEFLAKCMKENKSCCVATQSNVSLIELACKPALTEFVAHGRVMKTNLTRQEMLSCKGLVKAVATLGAAKGHALLTTYYSLSDLLSEPDVFSKSSPKYDVIVIEEASQAFLAAIAGFSRLGSKCLIVGDPMQLPPIVHECVETSCPPETIDTQSNGMMTYIRSQKNIPSIRIVTTRRLTESAARLTSVFYGGNFSSLSKNRMLFECGNLLKKFFPPAGGTVLCKISKNSANAVCSSGALEIIRDVAHIVLAHGGATIAILSPFVRTTQYLQRNFAINCSKEQKSRLTVDTVSRIQGLTCDYAIYYVPTRNMRFALDENLFNVATSRSRSVTLILSDTDLFSYARSAKIQKYLKMCIQISEQ